MKRKYDEFLQDQIGQGDSFCINEMQNLVTNLKSPLEIIIKNSKKLFKNNEQYDKEIIIIKDYDNHQYSDELVKSIDKRIIELSNKLRNKVKLNDNMINMYKKKLIFQSQEEIVSKSTQDNESQTPENNSSTNLQQQIQFLDQSQSIQNSFQQNIKWENERIKAFYEALNDQEVGRDKNFLPNVCKIFNKTTKENVSCDYIIQKLQEDMKIIEQKYKDKNIKYSQYTTLFNFKMTGKNFK